MSAMMKAWQVNPATVIRPITKNCFLAEFVSTEELYKVSLGGPWTYCGDGRTENMVQIRVVREYLYQAFESNSGGNGSKF